MTTTNSTTKRTQRRSAKQRPVLLINSEVVQGRLRPLVQHHMPRDPATFANVWQDLHTLLTANYPVAEQSKAHQERRRNLLRTTVAALKMWHHEVELRYEPTVLANAIAALGRDGRTASWLCLLQQTITAHREDAVDGLIDIGLAGISWTIPGGREKREQKHDYGIKLLHLTAVLLEHELVEQKRLSSESSKTAPNDARRFVQLRPHGNHLQVRYGGKTFLINGLIKDFVLELHAADRRMPYRDLWKKLYGHLPYELEKGGPPSVLRTLCKRVRDEFLDHFGAPPGDGRWIVTLKGFGFELNPVVNWSFMQERLRPGDISRDPQHFANLEADPEDS